MRHTKFLASIFVIISICSGCTTIKIPKASGGSKADAIIKLSYEYGIFEKPQIDWDKANATALSKCKAWGYENAEAFEALENTCTEWDIRGNCVNHNVTITYQCAL